MGADKDGSAMETSQEKTKSSHCQQVSTETTVEANVDDDAGARTAATNTNNDNKGNETFNNQGMDDARQRQSTMQSAAQATAKGTSSKAARLATEETRTNASHARPGGTDTNQNIKERTRAPSSSSAAQATPSAADDTPGSGRDTVEKPATAHPLVAVVVDNNTKATQKQSAPPPALDRAPTTSTATSANVAISTSSKPAVVVEPPPLQTNLPPSSSSAPSVPPPIVVSTKSGPTTALHNSAGDHHLAAAAAGTTLEEEAHFEAIRQSRLPLTDLYHPYVCPTDTSVQDARSRLETALAQTLRLRQAFTERVYGKYRVCLYPPAPLAATLTSIRQDPAAALQRLHEETEAIRIEKEAEKKEAASWDAELTQKMAADLNVDHAEQLMYRSAGLNLVILPEDDTVDRTSLQQIYTDGRGPTQWETGQRNRSISQAAATAGEVMLDRRRRAGALRIDRQRRQKTLSVGDATLRPSAQQALAAAAASEAAMNAQKVAVAARPANQAAVAAAKNSAQAASAKKPVPGSASASAPNSKSGRSRTVSALTPSALLNLHPTADQLDSLGGISSGNSTTPHSFASTSALVARGLGHTSKNTQWRFRHPHPESLGGKRHAPSLGGRGDHQRPQQPLTQHILKQTLPPLPTPKDRMKRKPVPVCTPVDAVSPRAETALRHVLEPFQEGGSVTKIELLHHLRNRQNTENADKESTDASLPPQSPPENAQPIDPVLAFLVMHSVGLIEDTHTSKNTPCSLKESFKQVPSELCSERLQKLQQGILSRISSRTLSAGIFSPNKSDVTNKRQHPRNPEDLGKGVSAAKRPRVADATADETTASRTQSVEGAPGTGADDAPPVNVPVKSIRGGGEASGGKRDDGEDGDQETVAHKKGQGEQQSPSHANEAPRPTSESAQQPGVAARQAAMPNRPEAGPSGSNPYDFLSMPHGGTLAAAARLSGYLTPPERFHHTPNLNALHLAQQLQGGDIAGNGGYLSGLHQRHEGYDFSSFVQGANPMASSSLAALGLARQNQAVAEARALYAREQQAAALLRGTAYPQGANFSHLGNHHSAAVAALLGNSNPNGILGHGQYGVAGSGHLSAPMTHSLYQPTLTVGPEAPTQHQQSRVDPSSSSHAGTETKESGASNTSAQEQPKEKLGEGSKKKSTNSSAPAPTAESQTTNVSGSVATNEKTGSKSSLNALPQADAKEQKSSEPQSDQASHKPSAVELKGTTTSTLSSQASAAVASSSANQGAMKFVKPGAPPSVATGNTKLIRAGRFHEVLEKVQDSDEKAAALEYLVSVGSAVPIPRAIVLTPLKERISTSGLKIPGGASALVIPRDIIASTIIVWLWATHEQQFQSAFDKSGRIDVDPDCKWLVQAAIDASFRGLTDVITSECASTTGPFAELIARKSQGTPKNTLGQSGTENDRIPKAVEIQTAAIVSKALMTSLKLNRASDEALLEYQSLMEYLDEARLCALRARSQERTLLATLLARKAVMTEAFSSAYVSAMVRAGEALGHGKVFESVQNEAARASTMIPYDVFTGDDKEWEDPCKPQFGYTPGSRAEDLSRQAHARAMIHKSLRKLQDRQSIRGGATSYGPYTDPSPIDGAGPSRQPAHSPRPGPKRKFSSISEPPAPPGTGSAQAKNWSVYEPRHLSRPLSWNTEALENKPYGRHIALERPRSLSLSLSARTGEPKSVTKKAKRHLSISLDSSREEHDSRPGPSTREIHWGEVAGIFKRVEVPKKSPTAKASGHGHHAAAPPPPGGVIFAPYCQKFEGELPSDDDESETEEDLTEGSVLQRHEVVLTGMKQKLSAYLEERRKQQERRKNRSSGK